jgi:hypothetical protein
MKTGVKIAIAIGVVGLATGAGIYIYRKTTLVSSKQFENLLDTCNESSCDMFDDVPRAMEKMFKAWRKVFTKSETEQLTTLMSQRVTGDVEQLASDACEVAYNPDSSVAFNKCRTDFIAKAKSVDLQLKPFDIKLETWADKVKSSMTA